MALEQKIQKSGMIGRRNLKTLIKKLMKKPFQYATLAAGYIVGIVSFIQLLNNWQVDDNAAAPVLFLSMLVTSVAVMGFLFLSQPIMLYIDGAKKEAVNFFLQTLLFFVLYSVVFTVLLLCLQITESKTPL